MLCAAPFAETWVPDQRRTSALRAPLHRVRDTSHVC